MKRAVSFLLTIIMITSIICSFTLTPVIADDSGITLSLKRDLATNGIYLRANMAHNGQTMIIAQYRDSKLEDISISTVDNGEGYHDDSIIITDYLPTDTFKGFLWNSANNATPIVKNCEAKANAIEVPTLWLDASDTKTVTLSDLGTVSNWADKSGNGRDVYQESLASQPVYESGQYVHTDGVATFLENRSPFLSKNTFTMFMMAELDSISGSQAQYITEGSATNNYPAYCFYSSNSAGNGATIIRGGSSSNSTVSFGDGYFKAGKQLHIYTDDKSIPKVGTTVYRSDKTIAVTPISYTQRISQSTTIDIFSIGARRHYNKGSMTTSYPANCKFKEIIVYNGMLPEEEQIAIKDYLLNKWGLEPSIPEPGDDEETPDVLVPDALTAVSIDPDGTTDTQNAYYYVPADGLDKTKEPIPLVVGLHSWSATYTDSSKSTFGDLAKSKGWAMIHPNFRGANDDPDACASELAVDDVVRAVEFMKDNANIDTSRIYLVGASGGGHMALSVAARRPDIWAAVSAWVPITDLAQWYNFSKSKGSKYYGMIAKCCGGAPGDSEAVDAEYALRSPINHLQNAINIPLDINTGIHDGHTGSVPISHSLWAFNKLATANGNVSKVITDEEIAYMVDNEAIPVGIANETVDLAAEGRNYAVHFRRTAGNARVTVFEGGHTMEGSAAIKFFEGKVKSN
ncbi:MAG: prolyl oligopeptidase family serine peptidase [Eubacteriales bacterium]|nr:prolyl oligopeptidase family serine peptidase [Eubacteriales bacterium]